MSARRITLFIATCIAFASSFASANLISWDGRGNAAGLTATNNITNLDTFTTGSGFQSVPAGTNGYSVDNPDFYAATSFPAGDGFSLFDGGGNDLLGRIQDFGADGGNIDYSSMIVWELPANHIFETACLEGFGSFGNAANGSHRILFQDAGGDWYASTAYSGGVTTITADVESWFAFTPHSGGVATIGTTAIAGSTLDFTNGRLAGYYQEFDTTGGGGVFSTKFEASGTLVPEPNGLTIAVLGLAAFLVRSRRR